MRAFRKQWSTFSAMPLMSGAASRSAYLARPEADSAARENTLRNPDRGCRGILAWRVIVGMHRGALSVASVPGDTRFNACLPIRGAEPPR
jgi:hypothetical protein